MKNNILIIFKINVTLFIIFLNISILNYNYAFTKEINFNNPTNYFYDKFYPNYDVDEQIINAYDNAIIAFEKKDTIKSLFYINNMLKYNLYLKEVYNLYGVILIFEKNYNDAITFLNKAINIDKNYKLPYINLGLIFYINEDWQQLKNISKKYLNINKNDFEANLGLAIASFHLNQLEEAKEYLEIAENNNNKCVKHEFLDLLKEYKKKLKARLRRL